MSGEDPTTRPRRYGGRTGEPRERGDLPLWFRASVIGLLAVTLVVHIMLDVFIDTYDGLSTSLMLGSIVGTAVGLNEFVRGRNGL